MFLIIMSVVPLTVEYFIDSASVCAVTRSGTRRVLEVTGSVKPGDVIYFDEESGTVVDSDENGHPQGNKVGVIRGDSEGSWLVDTGYSTQTATNPLNKNLKQGFTVELTDANTIQRIISEEPEPITEGSVDTPSIDHFKFEYTDDEDGESDSEEDTTAPTMDDFGGLPEVVERVREVVEIPIKRKEELRELGGNPVNGVLFYGDPGTGKTLLSRIIANETDSVFYEISGPEIINQYYGQSEQLIRDIFNDAADNERSIIFFDELDSIARTRNRSKELEQRVVAQLLTMMDGFVQNENIVVIGATNRREAIDPALLRPGRFDREVEFPNPEFEDRIEILEAHTDGVNIDQSLQLEGIADETDGWTGAELATIFKEATLAAAKVGREVIMKEDIERGIEYANEKRRNRREREQIRQEDEDD